MARIQDLRVQAGLSQSQLAAKAGIKVKALQAYESNGEHRRNFDGANLKTILKVCVALGCSLADIIEDDETKTLLTIANNTK